MYSEDDIIKIGDISPDMTFEGLAKLIHASDVSFAIEFEKDIVRYNKDVDNSITRKMYDIGVQLETERRQYMQNVLNQYKQSNPNATSHDESRVLTSSRKQFDDTKANEIVRQH